MNPNRKVTTDKPDSFSVLPGPLRLRKNASEFQRSFTNYADRSN